MSRQPARSFRNMYKQAALAVAVVFVSIAFVGKAHAAGELDLAFGYQGKVNTDFFNDYDVARDVAVQADGKIVVVGIAHFDYNVWQDFGIARYNADGTLDNSFGVGGKTHVDFFGTYDKAYGVAFQSDGKIVVVGSALTAGNGSYEFAVARLNINGTLDSTFGNGGKASFILGAWDGAQSVVIQPDNKIVLVGTVSLDHGGDYDSDMALVRLNSNGSLDTTFGDNGKVYTNLPSNFGWVSDTGRAVALYPDGKIVVGGSCYCGSTNSGLARYNSDGSLDTSFDGDGMTLTPFFDNGYSDDEIRSLAIQPDGKILAVGYATTASGRVFALTRYNVDGSLDTTFDGDGKASPLAPTGSEDATDVALTSSGKIVVVGYTSTGVFTLVRFQSNGSVDPTFGSRGRVFTSVANAPASVFAVTIQTDGKILAAGQTTYNAPEHSNFGIARFRANPTSIPTRSDFDGDGKTDIAVFRPSDGVWYVLNSSNGAFSATPFGTNGDIAAPGDFDGDGGRTDYAVFRPSSGTWYILTTSDSTFRAERFGMNGDIPVPADYDGDGKTDVAVFRPSNGYWYVLRSSDNGFQAQPFGTSTDRPVPGYYDNDEKADLAVFRESAGKWYLIHSSDNSLKVYDWGITGDYPVSGDFDGDGRFDIAVYRPGTQFWYILQSRLFYLDPVFIYLGAPGSIPVPGDYNGDSIVEVGVWSAAGGNWHFPNRLDVRFGTTGDTPVPAAYLH